jgi:hypothetical protein
MIGVTYEVGCYRQKLRETVRAGDVVIEIGPHVGQSTDYYIDKAKAAILVDKGRDCVSDLADYCVRHGAAHYIGGDVRGFDAILMALRLSRECDVLAVDMGGGRYPDTVFKVWATWSGVFKPRDSIIRCRGLAEFLRRARVDDESIPGEFPEGGWLSEYGRGTPSELKKQLEEFREWVDIR